MTLKSSGSRARPIQLTQPIDIYYKSWVLKNTYRKLILAWSDVYFAHLVSKYLPLCSHPSVAVGSLLHHFSAMCLFSVKKCNLFQSLLSPLCASVMLFVLFLLHLLFPLHDDGCGFANHELSPVPHPLGNPLSAPSALFPVVLFHLLLPLSVLVLSPFFLSLLYHLFSTLV